MLWLPDALKLSFGPDTDVEAVHRRMVDTALRICELLDQTGESFAEFGLDLALDRKGGVWVIEANVVPTFHGFELMDRNLWRSLLAAPLLYASQLVGFGAEGEDE